MLFGGKGSLAATRQFGIGVLLYVEGLLHHVRCEVDGRPLQQLVLLRIHCKAYLALLMVPNVIGLGQSTVKSKFIGVALAPLYVRQQLHPEEISNLKNSPWVLLLNLLSSAYL